MAGFAWRRNRTSLARRRQRDFLSRTHGYIDCGASQHRKYVFHWHSHTSFSVSRTRADLLDRHFQLRRNQRRPAVPGEPLRETCKHHTADDRSERRGRIAEVIQRDFRSLALHSHLNRGPFGKRSLQQFDSSSPHNSVELLLRHHSNGWSWCAHPS